MSFYFNGSSIFTANTAARGGGEYLVGSFNYLSHNTVVTMVGNNATEYGGGVYVEDSDPVSYCLSKALLLCGVFFKFMGHFRFLIIPQLQLQHFVYSSISTYISRTIMQRYQAALCTVVQ